VFLEIRAYESFASAVRTADRFALSSKSKNFLEEFASQLKSREQVLPKGYALFRAANDHEEVEDELAGISDLCASGEARMLPKRQFSFEGRVNPSGIVVLYLATTCLTAVSEIRPWVGDLVSVVSAETKRDLRLVDVSRLHGEKLSSTLKGISAELRGEVLPDYELNAIVWADIDSAFSRPVTRSETDAQYAPTQILAATIKNAGYDGIAYKSSFGGDDGYNVALFDIDDVTLVSGHLYLVKDIKVDIAECANPWFRAKKTAPDSA
jgi:RES domain